MEEGYRNNDGGDGDDGDNKYTEPLLYARRCSKHFRCTDPFTPPYNPVM